MSRLSAAEPAPSATRPPSLEALDVAAFKAAPRIADPFDFLIVPRFLTAPAIDAVRAAFPISAHGGVEPAQARDRDDALGRLIVALKSPAVTALFAEKFDVDLDPNALMVTLRSRCRLEDGKIHTDSLSKLVTALIYLEPQWPHAGGRLRLLFGPDNLEAVVAEAPPVDGALLAFRRSDRSWHGHAPHEGVRRMIMLNWMVDEQAARREIGRHAFSASIKRLIPGGRA